MAERAIPIADASGDAQVRGTAYNVHGLALMYLDYERGRQQLERSLEIAVTAGLDWRIATAYGNLGSNACELFHFFDAERYLQEGLAYTAERDLDDHRLYQLGWLAAVHLYRGRWQDAEHAAEQVIHSPRAFSNSRWAAMLALGRLQARRGEVSAQQTLDEALTMGQSMGEFQLVAPVLAARAEAAWLQGDWEATRAESEAGYALAVAKQHHWVAGEFAFWRWRAGASDPPQDWIPAPYLLQIRGDWQAAAEAWQALGCPYEAARAMADGHLVAQEQALLVLDGLGARPAAAALRRAMRAQGIVRLPRGPRPTTRSNRFGLTTRQLEILRLLAQGFTNGEIAGRLSIAPKTAEHHVAAVLAKLDVTSRQAAVRLARSQQLIARD